MTASFEKIVFKNEPIKTAEVYLTQVREVRPYILRIEESNIKRFNELLDADIPTVKILKGMTAHLIDKPLTPLIAHLLMDENARKPQSWNNPEIARSVLRMSATLDIADLQASAIDRAEGSEVQPSELQHITESFLKSLEERASQLPLEARG